MSSDNNLDFQKKFKHKVKEIWINPFTLFESLIPNREKLENLGFRSASEFELKSEVIWLDNERKYFDSSDERKVYEFYLKSKYGSTLSKIILNPDLMQYYSSSVVSIVNSVCYCMENNVILHPYQLEQDSYVGLIADEFYPSIANDNLKICGLTDQSQLSELSSAYLSIVDWAIKHNVSIRLVNQMEVNKKFLSCQLLQLKMTTFDNLEYSVSTSSSDNKSTFNLLIEFYFEEKKNKQ